MTDYGDMTMGPNGGLEPMEYDGGLYDSGIRPINMLGLLDRLGAYPSSCLRRAAWKRLKIFGYHFEEDGIPEDSWWGCGTEEGGYLSFAPTPHLAVERALRRAAPIPDKSSVP